MIIVIIRSSVRLLVNDRGTVFGNVMDFNETG